MTIRWSTVVCSIVIGSAAITAEAADVAKANTAVSVHLTSRAAARAVSAAEAEAVKRGASVAIVVIDEHGATLREARVDGAAASLSLYARQKAETSLLFGSPTASLATDGGTRALVGQVGGMLLVAGGVDLKYEGKTVGAVGVSGSDPQTDAAIASAAAAELARPEAAPHRAK